MTNPTVDRGCLKTRRALLWMNLTGEPLAALYALLPFILRKDLSASILQLSIFVALRPVLSVFSFYWSAYLNDRRNKLVPNLIWAWALARAAFLFLPLIDSTWFLLFACGCYQLFYRAGTPALMEILKLKIPKEPREHIFSVYYILSFIESVVLGIVMADFLDGGQSHWSLLFFFSALVGMASIFLQRQIVLPAQESSPTTLPSLKQRILNPWKDSFLLIRSRPDFALFQWGFMIGGFGLMLITPALAIYYADVLNLSHTNIAIARLVLMGIGVAASSLFWKRFIGKTAISKLTSCVLLGFGLFPLILLFAPLYLGFLYLGFFVYGVAQAGSHLLWNLSGTLFAPKEDSSRFSGANVLMVGLRGAVAPLLGGLLCELLGPKMMLVLGVVISFYGVYLMFKKSPVRATS